jgi:type I restriction enzyme S subunit
MQTENKKTKIPKGWKMTRLGEVAVFNYGKGLNTKNRIEGNIPVYGSSGITGFHNKALINGEGYIIGRKGTIGSINYSQIPFYPIDTVYYLTRKDIAIDFHYFYYLLKTLNLDKLNSDSAVPGLNRGRIYSLLIVIPESLKEQRAIAAILSSLDDKIELLREQNKTLEAIAQTIYKRWFVDFEFPVEDEKNSKLPSFQGGELKGYKSSGGKMVESELGEIPEGWKIGYLGDNILTNLSKTGIDNFEGEKIYLDTASVQGTNVIDLTSKISLQQRPSRANMQPKINSIWFAKMKNSKKALFFDKYSEWELNNCILSTGFAGLDVKEYAFYYLWNFITDDKFELIKDNFCNGTTMEAINNENIRKIKILIPAKEILELFSNRIKPLYGKVNLNQTSIQTLSALRDSLLPKLMSGKIRVPVTPES